MAYVASDYGLTDQQLQNLKREAGFTGNFGSTASGGNFNNWLSSQPASVQQQFKSSLPTQTSSSGGNSNQYIGTTAPYGSNQDQYGYTLQPTESGLSYDQWLKRQFGYTGAFGDANPNAAGGNFSDWLNTQTPDVRAQWNQFAITHGQNDLAQTGNYNGYTYTKYGGVLDPSGKLYTGPYTSTGMINSEPYPTEGTYASGSSGGTAGSGPSNAAYQQYLANGGSSAGTTGATGGSGGTSAAGGTSGTVGTTGGFNGYSSQATTTGGSAQQMGNTGYTAQGYDPMLIKAQQYAAQGLTVTPDMLVNNQVANLMKSPVGQMAMDIAREQMNSRGMLNSSAAVNAIVQAAIKAGLPIAEQDAQTYYNAANETIAAQNAAAQSNAAAVNTANSLNQSASNAASTFNANAQNTAAQYNATQAFNDYWKAQTLAEQQRQYNLTYAEGAREFDATSAIDKLQAEASAANTETDKANTIMTWIQNIASAGLDKSTVQKIADLGESAGLFTPETASMLYQYSVTPVISGVQ